MGEIKRNGYHRLINYMRIGRSTIGHVLPDARRRAHGAVTDRFVETILLMALVVPNAERAVRGAGGAIAAPRSVFLANVALEAGYVAERPKTGAHLIIAAARLSFGAGCAFAVERKVVAT